MMQLGSHETRDVYPMLFTCWPTVCDIGPTRNQYWINISCFHDSLIPTGDDRPVDNVEQEKYYGEHKTAAPVDHLHTRRPSRLEGLQHIHNYIIALLPLKALHNNILKSIHLKVWVAQQLL